MKFILYLLACLPAAAGVLGVEDAFPGKTFERPVFLCAAPDASGRIFVVEQPGRVQALSPGGKSEKVFLDITGEVRTETTEEGLLCLAFHPRFKENGFFYVIYSLAHASPRRTVLSRFQASKGDPSRADISSEKIIFSVEKPYSNHNGSTLAFGPDGYLYVSLGDGGSGGDPHGNAQNLQSLLGKVLRLDVDHPSEGMAYAIPGDNPFVAEPQARPEIYAYGLRNPWRMGFDPLTGMLWAGDVGQDAWEEVDLIKKGGNYGWNIKEGTHPFKGEVAGKTLIDPVLDYGRKDGFCVTGGYVYRGKRLPALQGDYIFGDFGSRRIWSLPASDPDIESRKEIALSPQPITSFGLDDQGELYILGYAGKIFRLR